MTIHCSHDCPFWGKEHDYIWEVDCDCGSREVACGYCLECFRVTSCLHCARAADNRVVSPSDSQQER